MHGHPPAYRQFHQRFMPAFLYKFWCQKLQSYVLGLRFFGAKILYEKCGRITLMKLTPWVKTGLLPLCQLLTKVTKGQTIAL